MAGNDTVTTVALSDTKETGLTSKSSGAGESRSSYAGVDTGLSLFSPSLIEEGIVKEAIVDFHPLAAIQKSKPIDFHISQNNTLYFDLSKSTLKLKVKITKSDDTALTKEDKAGFANNVLHTLFQKMDLFLNHKLISPDVSIHYPYKQMLDILCYYPVDFLTTMAQAQGFYMDTAYFISSASVAASGENKGFFQRMSWASSGQEMTVEGGLGHDLALMNCFLPSGVDIKIRLWPSSDDFALVVDPGETDNFKFTITECSLRMHGVVPTEDVLSKHNSLLSNRMATFHYQRSEFKSFTVPADQVQTQISNLYAGQIPFETIVAFVDTSAYLGKSSLSPFDFKHYDAEYLGLYVQGYQEIVFQPSFEKDRYDWVNEYRSLYATDQGRKFIPGIISLSEYGGGYSIFRFKLSTSQTVRQNRISEGIGRLSIRFKNKLPNSITILVYNRYHSELYMDKSRSIWLSPM